MFQQDVYRILSMNGMPTGLMCGGGSNLRAILTIVVHEKTKTFTLVKHIEGFRFETHHFEIDEIKLIDNQN